MSHEMSRQATVQIDSPTDEGFAYERDMQLHMHRLH
jgi:hypothetical protein